jgi:hypothetical protein
MNVPAARAGWWSDMANRCGTCDKCVSFELGYLSTMEWALWNEAAGDFTRYLNLMGIWMDVFAEQGIP